MSVDKQSQLRGHQLLEELMKKQNRLCSFSLGGFIGDFIGKLIDRLRVEEKIRSDLEERVFELENKIQRLKEQKERER